MLIIRKNASHNRMQNELLHSLLVALTKIDNSRAVRNRMSLGEITGIINITRDLHQK